MSMHALDSDSAIARTMTSDHEHLEQLFRAVMTSLQGGDAELIRTRWLELDHALERHLTLEEEVLLPGFERAFPMCAARLRREHREIRAALLALGVDLDLHELSPAAATRFITALRAHAKYEDAVLYPWAQQNLSEPDRQSVLARLWHLPIARRVTAWEQGRQHT